MSVKAIFVYDSTIASDSGMDTTFNYACAATGGPGPDIICQSIDLEPYFDPTTSDEKYLCLYSLIYQITNSNDHNIRNFSCLLSSDCLNITY